MNTHLHDVIGVGFGPSNLALAIALQELAQSSGKALKTLFLDKQQNYRWHGDTLSSQSELQISFLKDLVSLRNPTSPYSFVNYLKEHGRLVDFINLGTFYPSRLEFNDYLGWVASQFSAQASYGEEVVRIEPELSNGTIHHLKLVSRGIRGEEHVRRTRSVVISTGGTARIPEMFVPLKNHPHVFHHSRYLSAMQTLPCNQGKPMRIAIVGSGQSAAEAFIDLNDSYPSVKVEMILRSSALKPADDSPFVNEIFAPDYTDLVFQQAPEDREKLISEYHNTNYSVVDPNLIERIYGMLYRQKITRQPRHAVLCRQHIEAAVATEQGIELTLRDLATQQHSSHHYDAVILATGYERRSHQQLLAPLEQHLQGLKVDRNYRALASSDLKAPVFLQGFCEATHGLSDTLLSVLPMRSEEIARTLYQALNLSESQRESKICELASA